MFGSLSPLRAKPIPEREEARARLRNYRDLSIDSAGAAFREVLEDAGVFGLSGRNHYAHARNPPYWRKAEGAIDALLLRSGVGARLKNVNARLGEAGLKLFLYDAWRPRAVQAYFHDAWMPGELRRRRPELSDAEIAAEVSHYWAAPTENPMRPAPHETGAAVDLTIMWDDGAPLFMGTVFDDVTAHASTDWFERGGDGLSYSADEAQANRRLLYWLMIEAGFSNHPNEWWHYSYGDQMWAAQTGATAALYGLAAPESGQLGGQAGD
jgi:D-alanyl-D-alanine dipeptidase